jgi:hypothetical protein
MVMQMFISCSSMIKIKSVFRYMCEDGVENYFSFLFILLNKFYFTITKLFICNCYMTLSVFHFVKHSMADKWNTEREKERAKSNRISTSSNLIF